LAFAAIPIRIGHRDQETTRIGTDVDRAKHRGSIDLLHARALPWPPAAVIGMAFLSGAHRGQHGISLLRELDLRNGFAQPA
jgi:hypothetical protein